MAATPGAVQAEQSPTMPGPDGGPATMAAASSPACFQPEQRAAFMLQAREADPRHDPRPERAWRKDQIQKLTSMSDTDRQKFRADLQARWDALPADRKARIEQRLADRNGPSARAIMRDDLISVTVTPRRHVGAGLFTSIVEPFIGGLHACRACHHY